MPPESFENEDPNTGQIVPSSWKSKGHENSMQLVNVTGSNNYPQNSKEIRDCSSDFHNTVGRVRWQNKFL